MLCIFPYKTTLDAAEIHKLIEKSIGKLEHSAKYQERKGESITDIDTKAKKSQKVVISEFLKKKDGSPLTIEDFPDGFQFGNGVTAGARVVIQGETLHLTWCVFPDTSESQVKSLWKELDQIIGS